VEAAGAEAPGAEEEGAPGQVEAEVAEAVRSRAEAEAVAPAVVQAALGPD